MQTELQLAISVEQQLSAELSGLEQEVKAALERVRAHEKSQREVAGLVEELQREVEERTIVYRRQQDELNKAAHCAGCQTTRGEIASPTIAITTGTGTRSEIASRAIQKSYGRI